MFVCRRSYNPVTVHYNASLISLFHLCEGTCLRSTADLRMLKWSPMETAELSGLLRLDCACALALREKVTFCRWLRMALSPAGQR